MLNENLFYSESQKLNDAEIIDAIKQNIKVIFLIPRNRLNYEIISQTIIRYDSAIFSNPINFININKYPSIETKKISLKDHLTPEEIWDLYQTYSVICYHIRHSNKYFNVMRHIDLALTQRPISITELTLCELQELKKYYYEKCRFHKLFHYEMQNIDYHIKLFEKNQYHPNNAK